MKGFKKIDEISLGECEILLKKERDPHKTDAIKQRIERLEEEKKKQDEECFKECKNIIDYQNYLKYFPAGIHASEVPGIICKLESKSEEETFKSCQIIGQYQEYLMKYPRGRYVKNATEKIDDLFFEENKGSKRKCEKYLSRYPGGRHVNQAKERIAKSVRNRWIFIIVIIIIILAIIIGYKPSGDIVFSKTDDHKSTLSRFKVSLVTTSAPSLPFLSFPIIVAPQSSSSKTVSFKKEGGTQEVSFSVKSSDENIEVDTDESWIKVKKISKGIITITVSKNEGDKRRGEVNIKAYATLVGARTGRSTTGTIYVEQESGKASRLTPSNEHLSFGYDVGQRTITVDTDGFWEITTSTESWCHLTKSGNQINIRLDRNPGPERTDYFVIGSGDLTARVDITQKTNPSYTGAKILSTNVTTEDNIEGEKGISVHLKFSTYNMKNKECEVVCLFYDSDGNALVDKNQKYCTSNGKVSSRRIIKPEYGESQYEDFIISIPGSELHLESLNRQSLRVDVIVNDISAKKSTELCRKQGTNFYYTPDNSYLKINGETDITTHFSPTGGRVTYRVSTNASTYDVWGVPSWCSVENKTATSFVLVCNSNNSREAKSDYMKVKANGKEVRIDIKQDGRTGPYAEIEELWVDHDVTEDNIKGMRIHTTYKVSGLLNQTIFCKIAFYQGDNITPLHDQSGRSLIKQVQGDAIYEESIWRDRKIFIPYSFLNMGPGTGTLSFDVIITDEKGNTLVRKDNYQFQYTNTITPPTYTPPSYIPYTPYTPYVPYVPTYTPYIFY